MGALLSLQYFGIKLLMFCKQTCGQRAPTAAQSHGFSNHLLTYCVITIDTVMELLTTNVR